MSGTPTPVEEQVVIEGFAGPGGYSEGLKLAGFPTSLSIGIEINADACATGEKNGHRRLKADIATLDPYDVANTYGFPHGKHDSSPCPGMSTAGKGLGRLDLPLLYDAADRIGAGGNAQVIIAEVQRKQHDENSVLSLYPLWWQLALRPEWITMEQVPTVLPLWEMYAEVLRKYGYSVWTGNLNAEQYGVPQTRKRAVLMASRVLPVRPPRATHSRFYNRSPEKLDPDVHKWVSMAEALGWGMVLRPYPTVAAGTKSGGADPQMLGGSGARLIVARERDAGEGHWVERVIDDVHLLGGGLANQQGQRARHFTEPSHTITGKGTACWRFSDEDGHRYVGFPRKYDGGFGGVVEIDGEQYRLRDLRDADYPAQTVTEKARSWAIYELEDVGVQDERFGDLTPTHMGDIYNTKGCVRPLENPSMTLTAASDNGNFRFIDVDRVTDKVADRLNNQSGTQFDLAWPAYQPAAVVAGRGLNTAPGANGNRFNGSKKSRNDGVRITPDEAMTLQSFPEHYYFEGTKTSQFQQIGNAVPPLLGEAVVRAVTWTERRPV